MRSEIQDGWKPDNYDFPKLQIQFYANKFTHQKARRQETGTLPIQRNLSSSTLEMIPERVFGKAKKTRNQGAREIGNIDFLNMLLFQLSIALQITLNLVA